MDLWDARFALVIHLDVASLVNLSACSSRWHEFISHSRVWLNFVSSYVLECCYEKCKELRKLPGYRQYLICRSISLDISRYPEFPDVRVDEFPNPSDAGWSIDPQFSFARDVPDHDRGKGVCEQHVMIFHCKKTGPPGYTEDGSEECLYLDTMQGLYHYHFFERGDWHSHEYHWSSRYHAQGRTVDELCENALRPKQSAGALDRISALGVCSSRVLLQRARSRVQQTVTSMNRQLCEAVKAGGPNASFWTGYERYLPARIASGYQRGLRAYITVSMPHWRLSLASSRKLHNVTVTSPTGDPILGDTYDALFPFLMPRGWKHVAKKQVAPPISSCVTISGEVPECKEFRTKGKCSRKKCHFTHKDSSK